MRVGLLTSIWGRSRLTEIVLRYYAGLSIPGIDFERVAVVSPGDPDPHELNPDWHYAIAPNMPLTDKWNVGAKLMEVMDLDCVVITGSDDFLSKEYFEAVADQIESGADFIKFGGLHFYDAPSKRLIYVDDCFMGLGRCLSNSLMRAVRWQPYFPERKMGIDGWMDFVCRPHCFDTTVRIKSRDRGIFALDVKTDQNIKSFRDIAEKYESELVDINTREIKRRLPSVGEEVLSL